jgi:hypothetical protein
VEHRDLVLIALGEWGREFDSSPESHDADEVMVVGDLVVTVGHLRKARLMLDHRTEQTTARNSPERSAA